MKLLLYGKESSPPVRAVLLTLRALDLVFELRELNLSVGEHLEPEFLRKNPQHTIPMLEDATNSAAGEDGACICDSHAIIAYLVRMYGKEDTLYPKDPLLSAMVDQRLHFDNGILFQSCLKPLLHLVFKENVVELPKEKFSEINNAYALLDTFLGDNAYMAGSKLTIADFSIASSVATLDLSFLAVDVEEHAKLSAWMERMAELPYYEEANLNGAKLLADSVRSKMPKQYGKLWQKAFEDIKSGAAK